MYTIGKVAKQDFAEALKWFHLAAVQGHKHVLNGLGLVQQFNGIPTPPPGTAVTTILLTSANAAKFNNTSSRVDEPTEGVAIKSGCAA